MEPEEYQRSVSEGFGAAAGLVAQLGWVLLGSVVVAVAVVVWLRFRGSSAVQPDGTRDWSGNLFPTLPNPGRWLLRYRPLRRAVAFAGAVWTLAIGVVAGAMQADGGWVTRRGRYWCLPPQVVEGLLWVWSECRAGRPCSPEVFAYAQSQDFSTWHGRMLDWMTSRPATNRRTRAVSIAR